MNAFGGSSTFGQSQPTGFGQSNTSTAPAFGQTSTAGFGQSSSTGFGQSSAFGQTASSAAPAFGQTSTTGFGQSSSTGFGQPSAFGQTASSAAPAFGQTSTAGFGQNTPSAFGTNSGGFGAAAVGQTVPVQKQTTGFGSSMFGQTNTSQTGFGGFGSGFGGSKPATTGFGTTPAFGFGSTLGNQAKPASTGDGFQKMVLSNNDIAIIKDSFERAGILRASRATPTLLERAVNLLQSLDPNSSSYLFQSYFYAMVHPSQILNFLAPNNPLPAYQLALEFNPEPRCMTPVAAMGFNGINNKADVLVQSVQRHHFAVNKLHDKIQALDKKQTEEAGAKLKKIKAAQFKIRQSLTNVYKYTSVLANHGVPLRPKEETLRRQLETIQVELIKPHQFSMVMSQFANRPKRKASSTPNITNEMREEILHNQIALEALKANLEEGLEMTNLALKKKFKS
ncbi:hypothetical protein DSO57_1014213 [Entomophthora muscae]|uniref:Uncharacterized protein n=1 Tax=Entomophthora muscae TaxID=34485 RepID=A0ACC2U419_9FUNG|nr:hypothetical protein DSO57_1014213 [Entomophthora muscae]